MTASTPGFWSPIELSIPPGVSVTRGVGLPIRGLERRALAADRRRAGRRRRRRRTRRRSRTCPRRRGSGSAGPARARGRPRGRRPAPAIRVDRRHAPSRTADAAGARPRRRRSVAADPPGRSVSAWRGRRPARDDPSTSPSSLGLTTSASVPGDLLGGEDRTLAADALRRPGRAHDDAAEAGPDRAAHVLLHRHLEERLAPRGRRADGIDLAARRASDRAWRRRADRAVPSPSRASAASIGGRPAGERLVRPRLVLGDEVGHEAVVAERAVIGRDDVLDLVGQQARRVDLARRRGPEQERHLAPVADRLVGEHPDAGHAQPARDEQQVPAARVDLERPAERPEQVDPVAGPQPGEPVGPAADDPEVDRDDRRSRRRPC